jgi:hypothetical protein
MARRSNSGSSSSCAAAYALQMHTKRARKAES